MSGILFRNIEFGCKGIGMDSVHAIRWDDAGGIQTIRPLRFRTGQNPETFFGLRPRFHVLVVLDPDTALDPLLAVSFGLTACGKPLKGHATERAWTAIRASITRY